MRNRLFIGAAVVIAASILPALPASAVTGGVAGNYVYDVTGSKVTAASPTPQPVGFRTNGVIGKIVHGVQNQTIGNDSGGYTLEEHLQFEKSGVYASAINAANGAVQFKFRQPVKVFENPAKTGAQWTWSGKSTNGTATLHSTFTDMGPAPVTIGSQVAQTRHVRWVENVVGALSASTTYDLFINTAHGYQIAEAQSSLNLTVPFKETLSETFMLQSTKPS